MMTPTPGAVLASPSKETTAVEVLDASVPGASPSVAEASKTVQHPGEEKLSPKLQILIQRERAAVERERAAKASETSASARLKEIEAREARLNEFESVKTKNPRKALELLGLSYQELTQAELADGAVPAEVQVKRVEEKLESFVKAQEDAKLQQSQEYQKQQEMNHARTIEKFKGEITSYLNDNGTRYELISFEQSEPLVYDVIDEHYNRTCKAAIEQAAGLDPTDSLEAAQRAAADAGIDISDIRGEVMTIAQAADKVELHLEQKYDKARDLNKVKALLAPRAPVQKPTSIAADIKQQPFSHASKAAHRS